MHNWFNKKFTKSFYKKSINNHAFHIPALAVVWIIFGGLFTYAFSKLMIIKPDGVYIGQANSWSDWVVHISITNIFANKPVSEWFLYHPFFANGKLTYGFLVHLMTGMLIKLGLRIDIAFFIISILLLFIFLTGLYFLYYQISNSRKKSILGMFIFFTSSGMGIFRYINTLTLKNLLNPTQDFTKFAQYDWLAGNIPAAMILPQRAFFIGVTIGVWVLNLLLLGLNRSDKNTNQHKLFILSGILAGVLPIAHMHSFIAIVIITGTVCLFKIISCFNLSKDKPYLDFNVASSKLMSCLVKLLFFIIPAGVISIFLYFKFIHGGIEINNFMRVSPGWTSAQNLKINASLLEKVITWIKMWLQLWGTFLPLILFSFFYLKNNKQLKKHTSTFFGFISIFILANIIIFQPTAWDNTKLFAWVYLGLSILVSQLLFSLWNKAKKLTTLKKLIIRIFTIILLITLSFSGSVELIRILNFNQNTYLLSSSQEIQFAKNISSNTKTDAIFLTSTKHNHPIPLWANRPIFLGYLGWIKNFGFDHSVRIKEANSIYSGQINADELIIKNDINYIYVGPYEVKEFKVNYDYLEKFEIVFENENTRVYDVKKLRS